MIDPVAKAIEMRKNVQTIVARGVTWPPQQDPDDFSMKVANELLISVGCKPIGDN